MSSDRSKFVGEVFDGLEQVYSSKYTNISRCKYGDSTVILKSNEPNSSRNYDQKLSREFLIGQQAGKDSERVVKYIRLTERKEDASDSLITIILEDLGNNTLLSLIPFDGFPVTEFLEYAVECVKGLKDIHLNNIIHKDVKPANMGITFYQMLCGKVPFAGNEVMELIHSHIAVEPPPLPSHIPKVVSDVVMKLLKKDAAERYQSCQGLLYDLQECVSIINKNPQRNQIEWFQVGQSDYSDRFNMPKHLYGRNKELNVLINAFDRVSHTGTSEVVLVSGYSGIGKSSLVLELQRPTQIKQGYFAVGKFDQYEHNTIYSVVVDAIRAVVKQILNEGPDRILTWRKKMLDNVGSNIYLILELMPEVRIVMGESADHQESSPSSSSSSLATASEVKNRLDIALTKFFGLFATRNAPLVMFFDDLQWADRESVDLIFNLIQNTHYLMFVGSYRDNEVTLQHAASRMIESFKSTESIIPSQHIYLSPLSKHHVHQWIHDALQGNGIDISTTTSTPTTKAEQREEETHLEQFSHVIYTKTEGNPFFINLFMNALNSQGLLRRQDRTWVWDLSQIKTQSATDNVVSIMTQRMKSFGGDVEKVLKWASCMGNSFDIKVLAFIMNKTLDEILCHLTVILDMGLMFISTNNNNGLDDRLQFAHDRVHEAALSNVKLEEIPFIHFSIACCTLKMKKIKCSDQLVMTRELLDVVDHLNRSRDLFASHRDDRSFLLQCIRQYEPNHSIKDMIKTIVQFNILASKKNQRSGGYSKAISLCNQALDWMSILHDQDPETSWRVDYDYMFTLYYELTSNYFFHTDPTLFDAHCQVLLKYARGIHLHMVYNLCISHLTNSYQVEKAMHYCTLLLSSYDITIPINEPDSWNDLFDQNLIQIQIMLDRLRDPDTNVVNIQSLVKRPDDGRIELYKCLSLVCTCCFLSSSAMIGFVSSMAMKVFLCECVTSQVSSVMVYLIMNLLSVGNYRLSEELGRLVLIITEQIFPNDFVERTRSTHLYNTMIRHWFQPFEHSLISSRQICSMGFECGEILFGMYCYSTMLSCLLHGGYDLSTMTREVQQTETMSKRYNNVGVLDVCITFRMMFSLLQGDNKDPNIQSALLNTSKSITSPLVVVYAEHIAVLLEIILEYDLSSEVINSDDILQFAETKFNTLDRIHNSYKTLGTSQMTCYNRFLSCLYCIRIVKALKLITNHDERKESYMNKAIRIIDETIDQMTTWNHFCPDNYYNKLCLMKAEKIMYVDEQGWAAMHYYEQSIKASTKQKITHETAIALELESKFLLLMGSESLSNTTLINSCKYYKKWGAAEKIDSLQRRFGHQLKTISDASSLSSSDQSYNSSSRGTDSLVHASTSVNVSCATNTMNTNLAHYDIQNILKASQVISSNIKIEMLLINIIKIMIKIAGASMGAIIIDDKVEAQCINGCIDGLCSIPLNQWTLGSISAVRYVSHTKSTICTGCAHESTQYEFLASDPFVIKSNTKSMLCMPVMHSNQVKAVLYMENNYMTDCFKSDQVNVLSILTTQVAISLENARFFNSQMLHMEQLAQVEKARAKEEQMYRKRQEEFVDRICHEIRNPIQGLIGNCELMDSVAKSLIDLGVERHHPDVELHLSTLNTCIEAVQVCGQYQKVITDDVLTLSKLEFNQVKLIHSAMSPHALVNNVLQMFEGDARKKKINLCKVVNEEASTIVVSADYNRISQILINLVSNAVKFTHVGAVTVSLCSKSIPNTNQTNLLFSVTDTGIGVDVKDREAIFDRFVQATQRNMSEYSGSGLGLFISRMLSELMNGRIWIEDSALGTGGSTFKFNIVVDVEQNKESVARHKSIETIRIQPEDIKELRLLVVEDNKINQRVLARMLTSMKCICVTADDGVDGLEKFRSSEFDVVLMDVSMPRMDGNECTKCIRQLEKERGHGKKALIVGLSGNARQEHQEQGYEAGMDEYLTKPIQSKDILPILTAARCAK
ncbi:hybrid signal transduction histidine kinase dhkK [Acrasis kona]|uniref:Hybrid signal transduction histidine kinase dhkK n=1 Tax=Acrasis kona TaxID=1008807 RepID=A0AAW2ZGE9_9EUKA